MRVTFASYHTISSRHGGPLAQLMQTRKFLQELGVEVKLMDIWESRDDFMNSDLFHFYGANFGVYDPVRWLYEHHKPYVVSPIFFTKRSPRTVKTVSNFDQYLRSFAPGLWSDYGFSQDICKWAEHILPNTQDESNLIRDGLGVSEEKLTVVPNGVEERFYHADPDLFFKKYRIKDFILNVGHIGVGRKNTLNLIRALRDVDHPAVIIGRVHPSEEAELCLKEAEQNKNLLIIPGLDHDSPMLASAYAACSVFILPGRYETPGIAALEAGLSGAKIVITPHGGTKDYFQDLAEYIDPYSVKSIRNGLNNALNRESGTELRERIKNNYLWSHVAKRTIKIYKQVLHI